MKKISLYLLCIVLLTGCNQQTQRETPEESYDPEARLKELNITLPEPPQPVANYVNGVRTGNLIFLAGKGPKRADGTELTGKLGQDVSIEEGYEGAPDSNQSNGCAESNAGRFEESKTHCQSIGNGEFRS